MKVLTLFVQSLIVLVMTVTCAITVKADPPPVSLKGIKGTKQIPKWNLQVPGNQATNLGGIDALIETANTNLLLNAGFEAATATTGWTVSNGTPTADTADFVEDGGKQSLSVSLASVNGTILTQCNTPNAGGGSLNFENGLWVKTSLSTVQVCSSVNSVEQACVSAPSTNTWTYVPASSVTTASQSVCVYAKTTSSTSGTVKFDAGYNGLQRRSFSVVSSASGVEVVARLKVAFCTTSPCTITDQSGSVSSVTRLGTGLYQVNFLSGVFSIAPTCSALMEIGGGNTNAFLCQADVNTLWSATTAYFQCRQTSTNTAADAQIQVLCQGPK